MGQVFSTVTYIVTVRGEERFRGPVLACAGWIAETYPEAGYEQILDAGVRVRKAVAPPTRW